MDCSIRLVTIASKALLYLVNVRCVKGDTAAFVFQQRIVSCVLAPQSVVTAISRLKHAVFVIFIYVKPALTAWMSVPFALESCALIVMVVSAATAGAQVYFVKIVPEKRVFTIAKHATRIVQVACRGSSWKRWRRLIQFFSSCVSWIGR